MSDTTSVTDLSEGDTAYEPTYHVLSHFLRTEDGTNVAECLRELTSEIKALRLALASLKPT